MSQKTVTIFGTAKAVQGDEAFTAARQIGKTLAGNGFVIANGGYAGTMLAAAKSAAQAKGKVIGVTCSAFGSGKANEYVTEEIVTDSLQERLNKLIELGDAYIVLPGGTGTLLELAAVWELKNKGFFDRDKPIIITGPFWKGLVELIESMDAGSTQSVQIAETPAEAVKILNEYFND